MFANNSSIQQHDKQPQAASTLAAGLNNFQTSSLITSTSTAMNNLIKSHINNNSTTTATTTTTTTICDDVNNNVSSLVLNNINENNNNNINNLNFCYNKNNNINSSFDSDIQNLLYQQNSINNNNNNNNNKLNLQQQQQFQNTLRNQLTNQSIQNYLNYVTNKNTELAANDVNSTTNNNNNNKFDVKNYLSLLQQHQQQQQQQQQQTMDFNKPQNYFPSFTPSLATSLMNGSTNSKYKLVNNNNTPSTNQQNTSNTQIPINILQKLQVPLQTKMQQLEKLKDLTALNETQQSIQAALINQINAHQANKLLSNSISSTFPPELDNSVRVSPDGNIKNVPSDMLLNQFGMIGLLMMLSRKEDMSLEDENASMIIGKGEAARSLIQRSMTLFTKQNYPSIYTDLLDDTSPTNNAGLIHLTSAPLNMPQEYLGINAKLKDKLPEISYLLKTCKEEFLFFLFHICCQDELQIKAAAELTSRKWMYHQEWKVWLKSAAELENNNISNNNQYYWFDYNNWELHKMTFE